MSAASACRRMCVCVCVYETNSVCVYVCICVRGGSREASRKWGWRGRVRISNRMRIERKYEAQESHEPERLTLLPPHMCTAIIPSSN